MLDLQLILKYRDGRNTEISFKQVTLQYAIKITKDITKDKNISMIDIIDLDTGEIQYTVENIDFQRQSKGKIKSHIITFITYK